MTDGNQIIKMLASKDTEMRNLGAVLAFGKGHEWIRENIESLDAENSPKSGPYLGVRIFVDHSGFKLVYIPFTMRDPMNWWWTTGKGCENDDTVIYNIP